MKLGKNQMKLKYLQVKVIKNTNFYAILFLSFILCTFRVKKRTQGQYLFFYHFLPPK